MAENGVRVFDCFTFYNEISMLKLRLAELEGKVDQFILVEAGETFSGLKKENVFKNNRNLFSANIHAVSVDKLEGDGAWQRESWQRELFRVGLQEAGARDHDIVIISDVDEIIDSNCMDQISRITIPVNIHQEMYYYDLRCKMNVHWTKAKAIRYWDFKHAPSIDRIRMSHFPQTISPGGWHFSYFGNAEWIMQKIRSFSHQEYNNPQFVNKEKIDKAIEQGIDLFDRGIDFQVVPIQENKYLPKNYEILLRG